MILNVKHLAVQTQKCKLRMMIFLLVQGDQACFGHLKITEKVSVLYFMASFLKEIGNSRNLAIEKSLKIGKNRLV